MTTNKDYQDLLDQIGALRATLARQLAPTLAANPQFAEVVSQEIDDLAEAASQQNAGEEPPTDEGLADLIGLGANAPKDLGAARLVAEVQPYDETVTSERIIAMADLYYVMQHEIVGVFRVIRKLQQLFDAGAVRLSSGDGAYRLYRLTRREVLRFKTPERLAAYRRAFGSGNAPPPAGSKPNVEFHPLFTHFIREVTLFWRDKRISEVIREGATDPTFGSIATVRRAGLDLRNNLKFASYGPVNVLRVEALQLLDESFRILGADDIRKLFGADTAWDVVEEVLTRYYNEHVSTSPRQRMAVAGRRLLSWLAQPHILQSGRTQFEALLVEVAEWAEEWLTSAESLGIAAPRGKGRVVSWQPRSVAV